MNKKGILVVDPEQKINWNNRLNKLRLYTNYWIKHIPDKHITIESLYFDEKQIKLYNPNDFK